jgi:guanylate kinase
MNKRLEEALAKVKVLSDDQQREAAEILFEYIEARKAGTWLTPEQVAEIERRLEKDGIATDEEVENFFKRRKS